MTVRPCKRTRSLSDHDWHYVLVCCCANCPPDDENHSARSRSSKRWLRCASTSRLAVPNLHAQVIAFRLQHPAERERTWEQLEHGRCRRAFIFLRICSLAFSYAVVRLDVACAAMHCTCQKLQFRATSESDHLLLKADDQGPVSGNELAHSDKR